MFSQRILPNHERTDLVTFSLKVEGFPIGRSYPVMSISVHKEVNKVPWAKICIRDGNVASQDFPVSNDSLFVPGNTIEVLAGYHSDEETIFKGIIIKHGVRVKDQQPSVMEILCKDEAVKMTIGRKNKYFYNVKDKDIIDEILRDYNISGDVEGLTDPLHKEVVQYYTTDWDFALTRADVSGKLVLIDDGTFQVKAPQINLLPDLNLEYGSSIREFEAEMDARYQYANVKASAWNYADQELIEEDAQTPTLLGEQGNISSADLADVIGLDDFLLRHSGELTDTELSSWASAQLTRSRLAKIRGRVRILGVGSIKPGMTVNFQGVGDRFNGPAFVATVHHQIQRGTWLTDIQFGLCPDLYPVGKDIQAPAAGGLIPGIAGLQIGVVTQLEQDPDQEDRILVQLPLLDNQADGIWARVASLDAGRGDEDGSGRGAFFRPELGDEVIVGFINDDPRDAVVLGMLNSSAKPAPIQATDDNHEKGFVTRSQMKMIWNDDVKSFTVETPEGNKIVLTEEDTAIQIEDQNNNKIHLDSNGITIESASDLILKASGDIKLEGTNIENKANASFKAEGSAGANLESSATTVVKGALVQIN